MAEIRTVDSLRGILQEYDSDTLEDPRWTRKFNLDRDYQGDRIPFILSCLGWMKDVPPRHIALSCNPRDVQFTLPFREDVQETKQAPILHSWTKKERGTRYKEPVLNFTFQTGSVLPVETKIADQTILDPSEGLVNLYEILELADQPRTYEGQDNFVFIVFNSATFPSLTLMGFFEPSGISFPQSADDPHQTVFSASFIVHDTTPSLNSTSELIREFRNIRLSR